MDGIPVVGPTKLTEREIPEVPARYVQCARLANIPVPQGGWTKQGAIKALGSLRQAEIEKSDCLLDFNDWATGTLDGIRGAAAR